MISSRGCYSATDDVGNQVSGEARRAREICIGVKKIVVFYKYNKPNLKFPLCLKEGGPVGWEILYIILLCIFIIKIISKNFHKSTEVFLQRLRDYFGI